MYIFLLLYAIGFMSSSLLMKNWICTSYTMPLSERSSSVGFSHSVKKKKLGIGFFEFFLTIFKKMNTIDFFLCSFLGKLHCVCVVWISFLSLDLPPSADYKEIRRGIIFLSQPSTD